MKTNGPPRNWRGGGAPRPRLTAVAIGGRTQAHDPVATAQRGAAATQRPTPWNRRDAKFAEVDPDGLLSACFAPLRSKGGSQNLRRTERTLQTALPGAPSRRWTRRARAGATAAFSLTEMLVVVAIIAILLAVALPNLRGTRGSAEMDAAVRQLIGDLSIARGTAIARHTTVSVVFIPSDILTLNLSAYSPDEAREIRRLQGGVYSQYALFAFRQVGDQPGRGTPRYLSEWKSLPEKTFIAEQKFAAAVDTGVVPFNYWDFPFPFATSRVAATLPCVAFNHEGRLAQPDGTPLPVPLDEYIPLARGAILYTRDANGAVTDFSATETPPANSVTASNTIVIDWVTGRPRHERAELR